MTLQLRPYQREALDALFDYWSSGGGNGLIVLPTGSGKSAVIATLAQELLTGWPALRIGVVTHVRELVRQNMEEMLRIWPQAPVGIYSAGLGRRDARSQILFCSIQSVYNRTAELGAFDVLIVDEAHLIGPNASSMYGKFIVAVRDQTPDARLVGLTATPFRMDAGRLDSGKAALFDQVVYTAEVGDLIDAGYLSNLISKGTAAGIDVSKVQIRGGEFVAGSLENAARAEGVVRAACEEMVQFGQDRRAWIAFCSGVQHATDVRDELRRLDVAAEVVHGELDAGTRDRIVQQFKAGQVRCLTSVAVLTTGFNAPQVDMIAMLRPTLSTGLYVQMIGRGLRLAPGKADCLVLDFAENVKRHGPIDAVRVKSSKQQRDVDGEGEVKVKADTIRAKECPACKTYAPLNATKCVNPHCDHVWPVEEATPKHKAQADAEATILSRGEPQWIKVFDTSFHTHRKMGKPDSVRVEYQCGLVRHSEWWCFEHTGFARQKAREAWRLCGGDHPVPDTVEEALARIDELKPVVEICIRPDGDGYNRISGRRHGQRIERPQKARTWFQVLGVRINASREEVDAAFRVRAREAHPDTGGSHDAFVELNAARAAALHDIDLRDFQ